MERALRLNPSVAAEFAQFGVGGEVMTEVDNAAYRVATNPSASLLGLQQYLYLHPGGAHAAEAQSQLAEIQSWITEQEAAGHRALSGFSLREERGSAPPNDTFGAIAISRSSWRVAFVTDYATPDEALSAGTRVCNGGGVRDCDAYAFRNVCAALAVSPTERTRGMAWAHGQDDAVHGALDQCQRRGGRSCVAVHSVCTGAPPREQTTPAASP